MQTETRNQFDYFVEDLISENLERPLIIVSASMIDQLLLRILSKFLIIKKGNQDDLLEGDSPIGTFSARIKLVYRLGIIGSDLFGILEQIRKIRNLGAHEIQFDVKVSPIRDHIVDLKRRLINRDSYKDTLNRYLYSIPASPINELKGILITICVLLEIISEQISTTPGISNTLSISSK